MLMQPQSPSSDKSYNFIFNETQKTKRSLVPNMSGPVLILVIAVGLIVLLILISVLFLGKGKTSSTDLVEILGRAQEINRVNTLEQQQLKDPNTQGLLATTQVVLTSQQTELNGYAKAHKIKVDAKKLATYQNSQTDAQLQTAAQNNNLDSAYSTYLKQALQSYSGSLAKAYQDSKDNSFKATINSAYISTQTLLGNPPKST